MSVGVIAFIVVAVGFIAVIAVVMTLVFFLIRRSRPGRAGAPADGRGTPGVVRSVLVTVDQRPPARFQEDNDQRRVTVHIDVSDARGPGRISDGPLRPEFLPWGLRWKIFTKNPFRYGDLQLQMSDHDERMDAAAQARAGGYEFVLDEPVHVIVSDPGGNGRPPRWQVVADRS